jgi:hypothetical protein
LWNDRENMEETQVEEWKVWKKESWRVKWYGKYGRFLC